MIRPTIRPQRNPHSLAFTIALALLGILTACAGPQATASAISIVIEHDGLRTQTDVPAGTTVQQALDRADIALGSLDRADPPGYTVLSDGTLVTITRVEERFEIEQVLLPFERQTVRNEGLPAGETRLLQPGRNGLQEITYRIVVEAGEELSRTPVTATIVEAPLPEILMVGAQASFTPVAIDGTLAYLSGGNGWLAQTNTGIRTPVVVTGDLDGRVFDLSPDGRWLLYTRATDSGDSLNRLWALNLSDPDADPVDLEAENIIHFAGWSPRAESRQLAYSTAEASPAAPGWQSNNDLVLITLAESGRVLARETLIEVNAGGQYGWWGTDFSWAPDGVHLAYARADSIGQVDVREPEFEALIDLTPFQTLSDWAWVPGVTWGSDSRTLFFVDHRPPLGLEVPTASPIFDLAGLPPAGSPVSLSSRSGMFALPAASPPQARPGGEVAYQLAYLQADTPLQSEDSAYRLYVSDRDGSNGQLLFPTAGQPGLRGDDLQHPVQWSPAGDRIALVYRGDLWIIDVPTGQAQQITGDALVSAYDWASGSG